MTTLLDPAHFRHPVGVILEQRQRQTILSQAAFNEEMMRGIQIGNNQASETLEQRD